MKATPNKKEPAVSSYRPERKNTIAYVSFSNPDVKGRDQKAYYDKALQASRARVFCWLAVEAAHRGKSWARKHLAEVAWIRTNRGTILGFSIGLDFIGTAAAC